MKRTSCTRVLRPTSKQVPIKLHMDHEIENKQASPVNPDQSRGMRFKTLLKLLVLIGNLAVEFLLICKKRKLRLNHNSLLTKLEHYGIRGAFIEWFKFYRMNRKQYVSVNGSNSRCLNVTCRVSGFNTWPPPFSNLH